MIKVYKLKIGEKVYEVELEDVSEKQGSMATENFTPAVKEEVKTIPTPSPVLATEGKAVEAPMQGVILNVAVAVGDTVSEGDELVILEAMKMENPILAPFSGTIVEVAVTKGDNVDDGTVLVKIS